MKSIYSFFLLILLSVSANSQEKFTINGYIKDSLTGETLIGSNFYIRSEGKGVSANQYGFYSITLKKGNYKALVSFVGYQTKEIEIVLNSNLQSNILLVLSNVAINNVTVVARKRDNNIKTAQMGKMELNIGI